MSVIKVLYLVVFLDSLGLAFTFPLISAHILSLGGSLVLTGILQSLTAGAQLLASPIIGSWSDSRGRRLLLLSTLTMVFIGDALLSVPSLLFFFFGQILYGIAHQTDPLTKALIADRIPQEDLPGIFNKMMGIAITGFIVGPIVGGILYELFESFAYISLILCTIDAATLSTVFFFIEETNKTKDLKPETQGSTFVQQIRTDLYKVISDLKNVQWSRYGDLLTIKFILEAAFNMLFMNMGIVLMKKYVYTQTQIGFSLSYLSLSMLIATFFCEYISRTLYKADRTGFQRHLHGFVSLFLLLCVMPFTNTAVMYLVVFLPLSVIKAFLDTTWMEALSSRTTETDKGVMMGAASSMLSLAGLMCPLINGLTGDILGVDALILLPIFPTFLGMVLVYSVKKRAQGKQD